MRLGTTRLARATRLGQPRTGINPAELNPDPAPAGLAGDRSQGDIENHPAGATMNPAHHPGQLDGDANHGDLTNRPAHANLTSNPAKGKLYGR